MLGDVQGPAHLAVAFCFAHQQNRVRVREDIPAIEPPPDQVLEQHFMRGVQQQRRHLLVVVQMLLNRVGVRAKIFAEQVAGDPIGLFVQNLVVDVLKHVELKRVAGLVGRLHAIDHAAADAMDEIAVKKPDRKLNLARQFQLPRPPVVFIEIAPGDPSAIALKNVEQIAA